VNAVKEARTMSPAVETEPARPPKFNFPPKVAEIIRACGRDPDKPDLDNAAAITGQLSDSDVNNFIPFVKWIGLQRHDWKVAVPPLCLYGPEVHTRLRDEFEAHVRASLSLETGEPSWRYTLPLDRIATLAAPFVLWKRGDLAAPIEPGEKVRLTVLLPPHFKEAIRLRGFEERKSYSALAEEAFIALLSKPPAAKSRAGKE
jgi:hypothetical protein